MVVETLSTCRKCHKICVLEAGWVFLCIGFILCHNLRFSRNFIDDLLIYFRVSISKLYYTQLLNIFSFTICQKFDFTFFFGMFPKKRDSIAGYKVFWNVMIQNRCNFYFNKKRAKMVRIGFFYLLKKDGGFLFFFTSFSFFNLLHKHFMLKPLIWFHGDQS